MVREMKMRRLTWWGGGGVFMCVCVCGEVVVGLSYHPLPLFSHSPLSLTRSLAFSLPLILESPLLPQMRVSSLSSCSGRGSYTEPVWHIWNTEFQPSVYPLCMCAHPVYWGNAITGHWKGHWSDETVANELTHFIHWHNFMNRWCWVLKCWRKQMNE